MAIIKETIQWTVGDGIPDGYQVTEAGVVPAEWNVKRLREIACELTERAGQNRYETLSISAGVGFVNQAEKFGKELSGKQYDQYIVLHTGDFSYNKGNSTAYPQGCIYRLNSRDAAAVPSVFESFRIEGQDAAYYEQLFLSGFLNRQLYSKINRGVRDDGLLNLTGKDFYSCFVPVPPVEEQEKIAGILAQCDKVIALKSQRLKEELTKKRGLLERLFAPQWHNQLRELQDLFFINGETLSEKTSPQYAFYYIDIASVNHGTMERPDNKITFEEAPVRARRRFHHNDILMSTVRPYLHAFAYVDFQSEECVASTGFAVLSPKKPEYSPVVFHQLFSQNMDRQFRERLVGTNYPALNTSDVASLKVRIPTDRQVCMDIAKCLSQQDAVIKLVEEELHVWIQKKKALMQLLLTGVVRVK